MNSISQKFAWKIKRSAIPVLVCLAPLTCQAQFLDMLKDQALKAAQKVMEVKPPDPPKPAADPSPAAPAESNTRSASTNTSSAAAPATLQAYQNYDFVPGDTILFEDNFEKDEDGEFPSHWNQGDGQGAVNNFAGRKVLTLTGANYSQVSPAIKGLKYLADSWTVDFDTYAIDGVEIPRIYLQPDNKKRGPDRFSWSDWVGMINLSRNNFSALQIETHTKDHVDELTLQVASPDFMSKPGFKNQWHHIAIAFKEGRLKVYVDQFRVYSIQDLGVRPQAIGFGATGDSAKPALISNMRIANGAGIKIVDKKFTDAKIVTHGINFDNDRATIKPESMGTLNLIVDILKNNPEIRFDIQGHTDNSGSAAHNLALSRERAEAVKQQLVSMGVDSARLSTKGLGDTKAIADNNSPEGRANNRRVEFVTLR
jgi:outer membrane protein OmpA-like peptidoglycan-associated protein